jgi:hypothetical protein
MLAEWTPGRFDRHLLCDKILQFPFNGVEGGCRRPVEPSCPPPAR